MSRRRPLPLRVKIGIAGIAGVAAAWLIPKAGSGPAPMPTPSSGTGLTSVQVPLNSVVEGVSFRMIDGVRAFLFRSGSNLVVFEGTLPGASDAPIYWCGRSGDYEDSIGDARWEPTGTPIAVSMHKLDRLHSLDGDPVTIFPHAILRGAAAQPPVGIRLSAPCSANERLG